MLGEKEMTYHTSPLRSNPLRILDDRLGTNYRHQGVHTTREMQKP